MSIYPGNDSTLALSLGQGLSHIDLLPKGFAVDLGTLKRTSGNEIAGQTAEFRLLEIESQSELRESLNISASFSFKALIGGASGKMDFANRISKNNQCRYLMVHTRVANELELADSYTYKQSVQSFLRDPRNLNNFSKHFGTEFVFGRRTGGQFYAIIQFEFSSSEQEQSFNTALKASGMGWKGSTNIDQALSQFNQSVRTQIFMFKEGGVSGLPQIDEVTDFALAFDKVVDDIKGSPITLELIAKDYSGVQPVDIYPNPQILIRQERTMTQLAKNRDTALELLNSVQYIMQNSSEYEIDPAIHKLSQWEQELNLFINKMNNAAVDCFEDVFNKCELPINVSLPTIVLPKKLIGLGRLWLEEESGWTGRWKRQGSSNLFDARWTRLDQTDVTAVMTINRNGNAITIERRNSSDGNDCDYVGIVSGDGNTVTGNYTCNRGGGHWKASIN